MTEINFVTTDSKQIVNDLINKFEQATGEVFYPGDERRLFLLNEALVLIALYNAINETGKQNLLRYAKGIMLDALGERTNTPRLQAQKSSVTVRFTLSEIQVMDIIIPAGTRVSPDGKIYFETKDFLIISAGNTVGDVIVYSVDPGSFFNDFAPGQINKLVDPFTYTLTVSNIDTSSGGADVEADDDGMNVWSGYRERIRQSSAKPSTAGPEDAYIYWAKTANQNIVDVSVTSPSAGQVKITLLLGNNEIPSQGILDRVIEVCSDKKVRPLTDQVIAAYAESVIYDIELTYYISEENSTEVNSISSAIENEGGAVDQYKVWQGGKLGRVINPDKLKQLLLNQGAFKVDITSPEYEEIESVEVASPGTVTITYGGLI